MTTEVILLITTGIGFANSAFWMAMAIGAKDDLEIERRRHGITEGYWGDCQVRRKRDSLKLLAIEAECEKALRKTRDTPMAEGTRWMAGTIKKILTEEGAQ